MLIVTSSRPIRTPARHQGAILETMSSEHLIGKTSDVPVGEGRVFEAAGRMVAVFNDAGNFLAIDDMCPHAGASLSEGWLDNGCVTCPWHAWQFRLSDGAYLQNPRLKVDTFAVRVDGDDLYITVPETEGSR